MNFKNPCSLYTINKCCLYVRVGIADLLSLEQALTRGHLNQSWDTLAASAMKSFYCINYHPHQHYVTYPSLPRHSTHSQSWQPPTLKI